MEETVIIGEVALGCLN